VLQKGQFNEGVLDFGAKSVEVKGENAVIECSAQTLVSPFSFSFSIV